MEKLKKLISLVIIFILIFSNGVIFAQNEETQSVIKSEAINNNKMEMKNELQQILYELEEGEFFEEAEDIKNQWSKMSTIDKENYFNKHIESEELRIEMSRLPKEQKQLYKNIIHLDELEIKPIENMIVPETSKSQRNKEVEMIYKDKRITNTKKQNGTLKKPIKSKQSSFQSNSLIPVANADEITLLIDPDDVREDNIIDNLLLYLSYTQNEDGSFGAFNKYEITAQIALKLSEFNRNDNDQYDLTIDYLINTDPANIRENAIKARLMVGLGESYQDLVSYLLGQQNNDGGFGLYEGYSSDLDTTLEALWALWETGNINNGNYFRDALYYVMSNINSNGTIYYFNEDRPSYYLINKTIEYLEPFKNITLSDENGTFTVQSRINLLLSYLSDQYDNTLISLGGDQDVNNMLMALYNFQLFNFDSDAQAELFSFLKEKQYVNGDFGNSLYGSIAAMKALSEPNLSMLEIESTGSLQNREQILFQITVKNNGYRTVTNPSLLLFTDSYFTKTFTVNGSLEPQEEVILTVELSDVKTLIGDTEIRFFINNENESNYDDNWIANNYYFLQPADDEPVLPTYFTVQLGDPLYGSPLVKFQWLTKPDSNRTGYCVAFKKSSETDFQRIDINDSYNDTSYSLYGSGLEIGETYQMGVCIPIDQTTAVFDPNTAVDIFITTEPESYTSSLNGQVFTSESLDLNGTNSILESSSDANGNFYFDGLYNGSVLLWTDNPAYCSLKRKASLYPSQSIDDFNIFTVLKDDTTIPVVSALEMLNQGSVTINRQVVNLSTTASDNIALKQADFYYYDPVDEYWAFIATVDFQDQTAEVDWYIPEDLAGTNYKLGVVAIDFQNNESERFETAEFEITSGYFIEGVVERSGTGIENVTINASQSGVVQFSATTDSSGAYKLLVLNGSYDIEPVKNAYVFSPSSTSLSINSADHEDIDFSVLSQFGHASSVLDNQDGAELETAAAVYVQDNYAYVASYSGDLEIINTSDPLNPFHVSSIETSRTRGLFINGDYAYIAGYSGDSLSIIDVSNPANPAEVGSIINGQGGAMLDAAHSVYVQGNYAYVASYSSDALEIIDISDPTNPAHTGVIIHDQNGAKLDSPISVYVQGNYAYVASYSSNALEIVNISDPANPVHAGVLEHGSGGALLLGAHSVYVQDNYAYVASYSSNALEIVNISDPANPVHAGVLEHGSGGAELDGPRSVYVQGNYAYVASYNSDALEIIDISDPANPTHANYVLNGQNNALLNGARGVYVANGFAYVASWLSNALEIIDLSTYYTPKSEISLSDNEHEFINVEIGSSGSKTFSVYNIGDDDLIISSIAFSSGSDTEFTIENNNCLTSSIEKNNSCTFDVSFAPSDVNLKNATVVITSNAYNQTEVEIALSGQGIIVNSPPSIDITDPNNNSYIADTSFTIKWTDEDDDSSASIYLYYDTDNTGADGLIINTIVIPEDDETDEYLWDTSSIDAGNYYVYAVIYDDTNDPVIVYSSSYLTIQHCVPPSIGDWIPTESCTLNGNYEVAGNLIINSGVLLTIDATSSLYIDLVNQKVLVKDGGGILIENGGKLAQSIDD